MFGDRPKTSFQKPRPVTIELRDGRKLTGYLRLAEHQTSASLMGSKKPFLTIRTRSGDLSLARNMIAAILIGQEGEDVQAKDAPKPRAKSANPQAARRPFRPRPANQGKPFALRAGEGSFDPCRILGVRPGATNEELKSAWRRRIAECHPDKIAGQGAGDDVVQAAQTKAAQVNAAYQALVAARRTA